MIHADLESYSLSGIFRLQPDSRITDFVCVSQKAKDSLKKLHNLNGTIIYNMLPQVEIFEKQKNEVLKLITVSRMSREKGIQRCIDFAKLLPFDYEWEIYGEGGKFDTSDTNIKFMGFISNPQEKIAKADYLVQLSDCEGFCYSINEALVQRTPVLLTPFPSGFEQVQEGVNGYFIPFHLRNLNINRILKIPTLDPYIEKSNEFDWINFFLLTLSKIKTMKIQITGKNSTFKIGEIVDISKERAERAIALGLAIKVTGKKEAKKDEEL
jgi:glycosyltransferase involved in cell wall biosynthesis